jgi:hypothetical protein
MASTAEPKDRLQVLWGLRSGVLKVGRSRMRRWPRSRDRREFKARLDVAGQRHEKEPSSGQHSADFPLPAAVPGERAPPRDNAKPSAIPPMMATCSNHHRIRDRSSSRTATSLRWHQAASDACPGSRPLRSCASRNPARYGRATPPRCELGRKPPMAGWGGRCFGPCWPDQIGTVFLGWLSIREGNRVNVFLCRLGVVNVWATTEELTREAPRSGH